MPQLIVATYNIAGGSAPDTVAIHRLLRAQQVQLAGIQEVDRHTPRVPADQAQTLAGQAYAMTYAQTLTLGHGAYGIATLADRPLAHPTVTAYRTEAGEPRVFQRGEYRVAGRRIAVYNTHLAYESVALRQQQVAQLNAALAADPLVDKLVFGDFNMDQSYTEWVTLAPGLVAVNGLNYRWLDTFAGHDANMKVSAIDNILVSPTLTIAAVAMSPILLSDHRLLWARLTW